MSIELPYDDAPLHASGLVGFAVVAEIARFLEGVLEGDPGVAVEIALEAAVFVDDVMTAAFESDLYSEEGQTFEYTFEDAGNYRYYCNPHRANGMKGGVVVE